MPGRPPNHASAALAHFGDRLRHYREQAGYAQREVAETVGLSRSSIANMEAGRQEPGIQTLAVLASALGVTVDMLVTTAAIQLPGIPSVKANWRDLATGLQTAAAHYRKLADTAWQQHQYLEAIRHRNIADGLILALSQHDAISTGTQSRT